LQKFILDPKSYFIFTVLFKHGLEDKPKIDILGKIAGVKKIPIFHQGESIVSGSFIRLKRFSLHLMLVLMLSFIIHKSLTFNEWGIKEDSSPIKREIRQMEIKQFVEVFEGKEEGTKVYLLEVLDMVYYWHGEEELNTLIDLLKNKKKSFNVYIKLLQPKIEIEKKYKIEFKKYRPFIYTIDYTGSENVLKYSLENNRATIRDSLFIIDQDLLNGLQKFKDYLKYSSQKNTDSRKLENHNIKM
jgi:hypothetical protein